MHFDGFIVLLACVHSIACCRNNQIAWLKFRDFAGPVVTSNGFAWSSRIDYGLQFEM